MNLTRNYYPVGMTAGLSYKDKLNFWNEFLSPLGLVTLCNILKFLKMVKEGTTCGAKHFHL